MVDSYVCSGATMKCTCGDKTAKLAVLPSRTVFLTGQPMANISDHLSMVNLAPFGRCRSLGFPATASATAANHGKLTPMPCMHNTPFPWMGGKNDYIVKGDPALLKSSTCSCMWGGTISIIGDGQHGEGTTWVQKQPKSNLKRTLSEFVNYDLGIRESLSINGGHNYQQEKNISEGKSYLSTNTDSTKSHIQKRKFFTLKEIEEYNRVSEIVLNRCKDLTEDEVKRLQKMAEEMPDNLNNLEKIAIAERNLRLEKQFGKQMGKRMTISEADMQNANPNYTPNATEYKQDPNGPYFYYNNKIYPFDNNSNSSYRYYNGNWYIYDPDGVNGPNYYLGYRCSNNPDYAYSINCATCATAYALRLMGFDITAKGNTEKTINEWLSQNHSFDIWENLDGSKAKPTITKEWMKKNKINMMTSDDYKTYFDEVCNEEGVYILTISWALGGVHATILQRDSDGNLYWIEPQAYDSLSSPDGRRSIDDLLAQNGGLNPNPPSEITAKDNKGNVINDNVGVPITYQHGIMRVDNKLFKAKGGYTSLFD